MSSDIRIQTSFFTHPKTRKLQRRLGAEAVLCLMQLWAYVATNRPKGDLAGLDYDDIELAANWQGEQYVFCDELREIGFIDGEEYWLTIHDWQEHQAWAYFAPERSARAKSAVNARWEKRLASDAGSNTVSIGDVYDQNAGSNTPSPSPTPTPTPTPTPNPNPSPTPHGEIKRAREARVLPVGELAEAFTWWWDVYPGKGSRKLAEQAWSKHVKDMDTARLIIDATHRQVRERANLEAQGGNIPFWRHASTWLNQAGWQDEPYPLVVRFKGAANQRANSQRAALEAFLAADD